MKIIATLFFEGDPDALMGPEWEARVEGVDTEKAWGLGPNAAAAIADLKEWFCPCSCRDATDPACVTADECQHAFEESPAEIGDGCEPSEASPK